MCGIYNINYRRYFAVPFVSNEKDKSFLMTLKKLLLTFNVILFYFLSTPTLKADLIKPNNLIKPKEVVQIQLTGLMNNDDKFKDRGIEQTWSFAHPDNKKIQAHCQILR